MAASAYVLGVDIGTSGAKAVVVDEAGQIVSRGGAVLPAPLVDGAKREQDAEQWWTVAADAVKAALADLRRNGSDSRDIAAIAVDGTSGTVVPVDKELRPLAPGMMYNDGRASDQAARLNEAGSAVLDRLGYKFNASFALAKILWWAENAPEIIDRTWCILHQGDVVTARLMEAGPGDPAVISDESNALKTGFDILERRWPDYLADVGVDREILPEIRPIGATLGTIGPNMAEEFGLPETCVVVGGMSDGTAACAASGAGAIGDTNTTLGTTIVWKVIASNLLRDPLGRLYSHRHPGGGCLPGGAGNAGGEGVRAFCAPDSENPGDILSDLESRLSAGAPSGAITYTSAVQGERFPFINADFAPFTTASRDDQDTLYLSCLEGLACIERWGYDVVAGLGAECDGAVWTTGKGAEIDAWLQIRADVLGRPVCRAENP
ncbi:MAG: FGGY-family carbohydrate kinase, partial [Rhodospirillales bacterium]|nr:FGGY-family carbohydrate kinase [Rhodospirillales bacterium]